MWQFGISFPGIWWAVHCKIGCRQYIGICQAGEVCNLKCMVSMIVTSSFNSSSPGLNGHHFTDNICRSIFVNEKIWILIKNWLKFVPKGPIDNDTALVQIMAWRQIGDKPLSKLMLTRFTNVTLGGDELISTQPCMPEKCFKNCSASLNNDM